MNEVEIFRNDEFGQIRTVTIDSEPWFVGKDVAEVLGYSNNRKALADHVDVEDKRDGVTIRDTMGREQNPVVINESGLYALIFGSKLPNAKKFKHWVTSEVLPAIRKNGAYQMPKGEDLIALAVVEARKIIEKQNTEIERMKPKEIFADAVTASKTTILIGELAKLLRQNGIEIGQNRLFAWLRENGYLIKRKGTDYNMPTQLSASMGLFSVKETAITHSDGSVRVNKTVRCTGKGQVYFINKFKGGVYAGTN